MFSTTSKPASSSCVPSTISSVGSTKSGSSSVSGTSTDSTDGPTTVLLGAVDSAGWVNTVDSGAVRVVDSAIDDTTDAAGREVTARIVDAAGAELVGAGAEVVGAGAEVVGAAAELVGAGAEVVGASAEVVDAAAEVCTFCAILLPSF